MWVGGNNFTCALRSLVWSPKMVWGEFHNSRWDNIRKCRAIFLFAWGGRIVEKLMCYSQTFTFDSFCINLHGLVHTTQNFVYALILPSLVYGKTSPLNQLVLQSDTEI